MNYSRYLEAFYRQYSRRTRKGRDDVQYRYVQNYRITTWAYSGRVIAAQIEHQVTGDRFVLIRSPQPKKSKTAILNRINSISHRFAGLTKDGTLPIPESGRLMLYFPGRGSPYNDDSTIKQRILEIYGKAEPPPL